MNLNRVEETLLGLGLAVLGLIVVAAICRYWL
jgi:hypothetical protein